MKKSIELNQILDPLDSSRTISDIHLEGNQITVEFLDEEGSNEVPFEDLEPIQVRALLRELILEFPADY